jgi:hypothetical protein
MNNKAQAGGFGGVVVGIFMAFIAITFAIMFLPGLTSIIDIGKDSTSLNCVGYVYQGNANHVLSYNATIGTKSTIGCLGLTFVIPYFILGVLVAAVGMILYGRTTGQPQPYSQYG